MITIDMSDMKSIVKDITKLKSILPKRTREMLVVPSMKAFRTEASVKAPVDTGDLRTAVEKVRINTKQTADVVTSKINFKDLPVNVSYWYAQEMGEKPHFVPGSQLKPNTKKWRYALKKGLLASGRAQPYINPAYTKTPQLIARYEEQFVNSLQI